MATDSERFERALQKWDQLQEAGSYSAPSVIGKLAIMLPYDHKRESGFVVDDFETFHSEALAIADHAKAAGKVAELAINAGKSDFRDVMRDPTISDVLIIGNGCLSSVALHGPDKRVDWLHLSRMSDHLKTGTFVQRFCGFTPRQLNAPLGMFAVNDHRSIMAPVNKFIRPRSLTHHHNKYIQQVFAQARIDRNAVFDQLPERKVTKRQKSLIYLDLAVQASRNKFGL